MSCRGHAQPSWRSSDIPHRRTIIARGDRMAATTALVTVADYLKMSADPDCEYVGGVIEERPVGEYDHSTWQTILAAFFSGKSMEWGIKARTELRVQVNSDSFRVPD